MERTYDIILLGATGFTGRLTAEYMRHALPESTKWAIAGRSKSKLEALTHELELDIMKTAIYALDLTSYEDITQLAKSTRVVINTIGPYSTTCGSAVIQACAENGTDYVDCSGETPWTQEMIENYDEVARTSGAKIIMTAGWTAVAADISTYLATNAIRETFSAPTREILVCLDEAQGTFSGGSINSLCDGISKYGLKRIAEASSPFVLAPKKRLAQHIQSSGVLPGLNLFGVQAIDGSRAGLVVSTQEQIERSVIGRSWGLYEEDEGYGKNFFFSSRMRLPGPFTAWLFRTAYVFLTSFLIFSPIRTLLSKYLFPAGTGASAEKRRGHYFKYRTIGVADTDNAPGKKVEVKFEYDSDSYEFTGKTLTEAAVLLLEGGTQAHRRGGILTPATLGDKYVERLKKPGVDVRIEVKPL